MISIEKDFPLQTLNTFGMNVSAAAYSIIETQEQLAKLAAHPEFRKGIFVLGGGSNILFTKNVSEWVWHNQIKGVEIVQEDKEFVWIEAGAGEVWHKFIQYTISKGYAGVENLSLIPGNVGAAPVQNIGAYGVEVKQVISTVKAWHIVEQCPYHFTNEECQFGYRDSIFKRKYKGQLLITSVIFKLRKHPVFNIEYGAIRTELDKMGITELSVKAISDAVIHIRRSKLPDPSVIGNAGSFFKNPEINTKQFEQLKQQFPELPGYPTPDDHQIKTPAGWLIEHCGWKGYKKEDVGVHPLQALVLVNYGNASGKAVYELSKEIIASVSEKFGITLEREVQIY